MTKDEFEAGYAERSGLTVEKLHELGLFAQPCDCDWGSCQGWGMTFGGEPLFGKNPKEAL